jgi:hypothetical protein
LKAEGSVGFGLANAVKLSNRLKALMERQASLLLILAALALAPTSQLRAAVDFPYENDFVATDASATDVAVFAGANQNILNGQPISGSIVPLIASETTMDVGGAGIEYDIPFESGSSGQWVALTVPEPAKMALVVAFGALAFALFGGGKGRENFARTFLRMILRRLPPTRG